MRIEEAYSIEAKEIIDPELAYDYFWSGKISDKQKFECPSEDCDAQITCANLDKMRSDMIRDPHYRAYSSHSDECVYTKEMVGKTESKISSSRVGQPFKSELLPDIFRTTRPISHYEKNEKYSGEVEAKNIKNSWKIAFQNARQMQPSVYYSLKSFVSKYYRYRKDGIADKMKLDFGEGPMSYADAFVEIGNQELVHLGNRKRIYFGEAFVNTTKSYNVCFYFTGSFFYEEQMIRPSLLITKSHISHSLTERLIEGKLYELSRKNSPSAWGFVLATPKPAFVNGTTYINFSINNIDLFDFRESFL